MNSLTQFSSISWRPSIESCQDGILITKKQPCDAGYGLKLMIQQFFGESPFFPAVLL
jgi:hypothetical protein